MAAKQYKICFLAYSRQYELAKTVIRELPESDVEYILMDCNLDTQDECVQEALQAGCEVFVTGSGNAARFMNHYNYPLVEIPFSTIDFALAVHHAQKMGGRQIAIARHRYTPPVGAETLQLLLDIPIRELVFESAPEMYELARTTDCDAIVGASLAVEAAEAAGKLGVFIYQGTEGIRDACIRAANVAREQRASRWSREITKAIMDNAQLGVIVTDPSGIVQFINHRAQNYTGLLSAQLRGKQIADFFPNLSVQPLLKSGQRQSDSYRLVEGVMMRCVQERILMKHETIGVLITLHPDSHNRRKTGDSPQNINAHIYHWRELTALSTPMKTLIEQGRQLSQLSYPTVIFGEPGSGREEIAHCIHGGSVRAKAPCITIDLATFSEEDAPRVLFGYDKGDTRVSGLFSTANGGSVVLKNLALAKPSVLACIQQLVTTRELVHLGGSELPDVALYTMLTHEEYDRLPPDLRSALSISKLEMPPLRTRKEDIGKLFIKYVTQLSEMPIRMTLSEEMEDLLRYYSWPGNVRELRTVSTRYVIARSRLEKVTAKNQYLLLLQAIGEAEVLRDILQRNPALTQRPIEDTPAFLEGIELLKKYMKYSNDILAKHLNLSRTTLWRILRENE